MTRALARVYQVFVVSMVLALVLASTLSFTLDKWSSLSDPAIFSLGLALAVLVGGVPTFLVLQRADRKLLALRNEHDEDQRALNWQKYRKFIDDYREAHEHDQDQA